MPRAAADGQPRRSRVRVTRRPGNELPPSSPLCQVGVIPGLDSVPPVPGVVRQTAPDGVCGPAPTESAGSDQENGLASWRKVVGGGSGK